MAVIVIAQVDIHDRDAYGRYEAGFLDIFARSGGELLAVSDSAEVIEGEWPCTRTVVLRFPSAEVMRRWYDSPEYQALAQHRFAGARANIVMVDALPGA
jgi:uncharacterized protein (DUF1330 family)